jgi:hypothetical protein
MLLAFPQFMSQQALGSRFAILFALPWFAL